MSNQAVETGRVRWATGRLAWDWVAKIWPMGTYGRLRVRSTGQFLR